MVIRRQKKPQLQLADHNVISRIFADNFALWSPGLSPDQYCHYQWWQMNSTWGRRNLSYWAYMLNGEAVASCKLYNLSFQSRSSIYRVAGIGAVFCPERHRGNSYAANMLAEMIEFCEAQDFQAVMLHSDIDTTYYQKLGFELLGDQEFRILLTESSLEKMRRNFDSALEPLARASLKNKLATINDLETINYHYSRWLNRRSYALKRSDAYWNYKISREFYLSANSRYVWPKLEILSLDFGKSSGAYVLFEQSKTILRILEMTGSESAKQFLWRKILDLCQLRNISLIRGWQSVAPQGFIGYELYTRSWAHSMLLPLSKDTESWLELSPCPSLELDHF